MRSVLYVVLAVTAVVAAAVYVLPQADAPAVSPVVLADALGPDTTGYRRADRPRAFSFPDDHGPHPAFKTEWWYYTGNLSAADGRRFGYQLTFFRTALSPPAEGPSPEPGGWAADQLYMAHFALTDVSAGTFSASERFSRAARGLAGARAAPFRVWLEDWSAEGSDAGGFEMVLHAAGEGVAVDLRLVPLKPIVLQGEDGYHRKGPAAGDASYYYSMTRLQTEGTVVAGGDRVAVRGLSWMDREWSTGALGPDGEGWDWFALHLDDGRDLMYYRIRRRGQSASPFSGGVLVDAGGDAARLGADGVHLDVLDRWRSDRTGILYPSRWRLRIPSEQLDLTLTPLSADQELDVSIRYWEGAVHAEGRAGSRPIEGRGYVELAGYDTAAEGAAAARNTVNRPR